MKLLIASILLISMTSTAFGKVYYPTSKDLAKILVRNSELAEAQKLVQQILGEPYKASAEAEAAAAEKQNKLQEAIAAVRNTNPTLTNLDDVEIGGIILQTLQD